MRFPAAPPAGKLNGKPFTPQTTELSRIGGRFLTLRQGDEFNPDLEVKIALSAEKDDDFSGKTYEIAPDAGRRVRVSVSVALKRPEAALPEVKLYNEKLALRLEFGQEERRQAARQDLPVPARRGEELRRRHVHGGRGAGLHQAAATR